LFELIVKYNLSINKMANVSFIVKFITLNTLPANSIKQNVMYEGNIPEGFNLSLKVVGGFENVYLLKCLESPENIKKAKVRISYPSCFYRCLDFQMINENGWETIFTLPSSYYGKQTILTFMFYI
jgi:hypothetical protein